MKKMKFPSELAYVLGIIFVAVGVTLMEKADFGVSMIVAPAYLIYRWLSPAYSFVTFGMAEYCLQAVLLLVMILVLRRFRFYWLLSFATAFVYGMVLDGCMALCAELPSTGFGVRLLLYILGMLFCSAGVSGMFHTYISPEVYELFVKEVSFAFKVDINRFKTVYDCISCAVGVLMSFLIFGFLKFEGVKLGTILCALVNGSMIGWFSRFFEKHFDIYDALPWRKYFS